MRDKNGLSKAKAIDSVSSATIEILNIQVKFETQHCTVEPASAKLLRQKDDINFAFVHDQTLEDLIDFMLNIESILLEFGFEMVAISGGNDNLSERFYLRSFDGNKTFYSGVIYKARISTQIRTPRKAKEGNAKLSLHILDLAEDAREIGSIASFKKCIINGVKFDAYCDAEDYVEQVLNAS